MKKSTKAASAEDGLKPLTVRIPPGLHDFLNELKDKQGVMVQHAVKEALEDYRKKRGA